MHVRHGVDINVVVIFLKYWKRDNKSVTNVIARWAVLLFARRKVKTTAFKAIRLKVWELIWQTCDVLKRDMQGVIFWFTATSVQHSRGLAEEII